MTLLDSARATGNSRLHGAHALFEAIAGLPLQRRQERLHELTCDAQTIAMVEELLDAHTRGLDSIGASLSASAAASRDTELRAGDTLGAWKLVECLASGGMGTVFIAERADRLYTQRVAIKLMRGQPDAATTERMAAERQLLAQLQHPGIARLYDGGTTPAGQPYLVMEYVEGLPLLHYCREQRPGLQQRIELFQNVCRTVECAHRHMIVHCDLKPGNILVRSDGEPVLLDFGIARGLGSGIEHGGFCTPAYASPELLAGRPVSAASDVFSLGVVLIELLAAQRVPRDRDNRAQSLPAPSQLAGDDALAWRPKLHGDLDAIAAKACALDPVQRYSTVAELHQDLQRYCEHQPVLARVSSAEYRLRRLLRRRWRETAVLAVLSILVAGFVWRLNDERRAAHRAAQTADQVSDMLASSFAAADPKQGRGNTELSAREVLDAGAASLDSREVRDPAVMARLREVLGYAYLNLGHPQIAEPLMMASIDGYLDPAVRNPFRAAKVLSELAVLRGNGSRDKEATAAARRSLALREQIEAGPVEIADALNSLGITLVDADREEAEQILTRALELRRKHLGEPSTAVAATLHNLGLLQRQREDFVGAEGYYRQSMAMKQALGLSDSANYEHSLSGLAQSLRGQGRLAEAAELQRDALKLALRLYGDGTGVSTAYNELAYTLHDLGRWPDAARYYAASERLAAASAGENSIEFAISVNNHASLNEDRGAVAAAERGFRRSLAIRSARLAADNPSVLRARFNLGRLLLREGRLAEAGALIESAWVAWQRKNDPSEAGSIGHRLLVAEWLVAAGRIDEAAREVDEIALIGPHRPKRLAWLHSLQADLSATAGNRTAALEHDRQALQTMVAELGAQHVEAARRRLGYAARLDAVGDSERARVEFEQAVAVLAPQLAPNAPLWARIRTLQARLGLSRHATQG